MPQILLLKLSLCFAKERKEGRTDGQMDGRTEGMEKKTDDSSRRSRFYEIEALLSAMVSCTGYSLLWTLAPRRVTI